MHYLNEDDKAYGLAGMVLSVAALNASDLIAAVSLDAEDNMVAFSHEYYFCGSPSISPKATWENTLRNYKVTSAMAVANLFARAMVRLHTSVPEELLSQIHEIILDEGKRELDLEKDEAESVYNRVLSYNRRIFGNTRLHPSIALLAGTISRKRTLSGREIEEELRLLQLL